MEENEITLDNKICHHLCPLLLSLSHTHTIHLGYEGLGIQQETQNNPFKSFLSLFFTLEHSLQL